VTVMCTVAVPASASVPTLHVTVFVPESYVHGEVAETNVRFDGSRR
jgi:hypothetical protein